MAVDRPRPLAGFTVGVTEGPGQWEQARLFRSLGARVVPGFAADALAEGEADRRAALALARAAVARALDALTLADAGEVDALFALAASTGGEAGLRWALGAHVVVAGAPAAVAALHRLGVPAALEVAGATPRAVVAAVASALGRRVAVLPAGSHPVEVRGRIVTGRHATVELTDRERAVLAALARRAGVVSKEALLREAWGPAGVGPHTVEVTVARLRGKIEPLGVDVRNAPRRGYWLAGAGELLRPR